VRTRVQRWGNSLAVRIPKSFAEEVGLGDDSPVDLRLSQGKLVIEPSSPPPPTLEDLLRGIRKSNLHTEFDTGPAQGREAWS
jgi:antitoxin MazE